MNKDTRLNKYPHLLKKGQLITSDYIEEDSTIVRTLLAVEKNRKYGSGYGASADAGDLCHHCKKFPSRYISMIDAAWFIPVD